MTQKSSKYDCSSKVSPSYIERLKRRIEISKSSIRFWSNDRTLGNIYSLLLYEVPLIFSEGKAIAGFELQKDVNDTIELEGKEYRLMRQPLNTLHLAERVILKDHFEEVISQTQEKVDHIDKQIFKLREGYDQIIIIDAAKQTKHTIADYLGITKYEKKDIFPDSKSVYLFKYFIHNNGLMWILFCPINNLRGIEKEIYNAVEEFLDCAFEKYGNTDRAPRLYCVNPTTDEKKSLALTLKTACVDELLYTRQYLNEAIDNICSELIRGVDHEIRELFVDGKEDAKNVNNRMRALFLRTTRPDVNYFTLIITPLMWKEIFKEIRYGYYFDQDGNGNTVKKRVLDYAKQELFSDYKKYIDELKIKEVEGGNWQKYLKDRDLINIFYALLSEEDKRSLDLGRLVAAIEVMIDDMNKGISEYLTNGKSLPTFGDAPIDIFKLTVAAVSFIETTPLIAGLAYTVGKKGVPYYCSGWQKDLHPYLKTIKIDSPDRELRYPAFIENFLDNKVLRASEYPLTLNFPVVLNGILFGVFILYPKIAEDQIMHFEERQGNFLYKILRDVEKGWPDLIRAFFLDVCSNVTRILSGIMDLDKKTGNKMKSVNEYIKQAEKILRKVHNVPRTYIIDARDVDTNIGLTETQLTERLKDYFIKNYEQTKITELAKALANSYTKNDFLFSTNDKLTLPPENPEIDIEDKLYLNIYCNPTYASYKLIAIEDWRYFIVQISEKPWRLFSQREKDNSTYLCQAIETGLMAFRRQHKIIEKSSKAAMTAIMSRNLSHNIGSHVLSYWNIHLNKLIEPDDSKYSGDNTKMTELLNTPEYAYEKFIGNNQASNSANVNWILNWMGQTRSSKDLFEYIQHRMDFLAEFTTSTPGSELSLDIETDILFPVLYSRFSALLKYIAHSEGIDLRDKIMIHVKDPKNKRVSIPNGLVGIHALYSILENFIRNAAKHYKGATYCLKEDVAPDKAKEYLKEAIDSITIYLTYIKNFLELNNGTTNECGNRVGGESFYGAKRCEDIKEKLSDLSTAINHCNINNLKEDIEEVKKYVGELHKLQNEIPFIYICIDAPSSEKKWRDDFLSMTIWDMREMSCNYEIVEKLRDNLPEGKYYKFITDAEGELASGAWGIKEILMSANFLRKNKPEMLLKDTVIKEDKAPKLLEIMCNNEGDNQVYCKINTLLHTADCENKSVCCHDDIYKNKFGVRFYLKKPKDLAIVGDSLKELKSKVDTHRNNPNKVFEIEYFGDEEIKNIDEIPHKILLVASGEKGKYEDKAFAPCRIMEYDKNIELGDMIIDDDYYLCLYETYVKAKVNNKLHEHKLVCAWTGNEFPPTSNNAYTKDQLEHKDREIVFFNHPESSSDGFNCSYEKCSYVQPISGSYSTKAKLMGWKTLGKINIILRNHFFLELLESAFIKIVIVDERVSQWANGVFLNNLSRRQILKKMKIVVPKIDLNNCSYKKIEEELGKEAEYNVLNGISPVHFFIIHQGVLDKMGKDDSAELLKNVKCDWKVVDSGRGVPKELEEDAYKGVRFIEISTLLKMMENYDKHGIVQTLCALRRPRGNYENEEGQNA